MRLGDYGFNFLYYNRIQFITKALSMPVDLTLCPKDFYFDLLYHKTPLISFYVKEDELVGYVVGSNIDRCEVKITDSVKDIRSHILECVKNLKNFKSYEKFAKELKWYGVECD